MKVLFGVLLVLLAVQSVLCVDTSTESFTDDSEYRNLLEFDDMLRTMEQSILERDLEQPRRDNKEGSLALDYANLAMMYHQRNDRWKQGGTAESLHYIELALQAQQDPHDNAHTDASLQRSMLLHKGVMLTSLGKRIAALNTFNQLEDKLRQKLQKPVRRSTWLTSKAKRQNTEDQELAKVLMHKAELLYTLFDAFDEAVQLYKQALELHPCHFLIHQHLVHAMKGSKITTVQDWHEAIDSMKAYLLSVKQRPAHSRSREHRLKYKAPPIEYRVINPTYRTNRLAQLRGTIFNPLHWLRVFYTGTQDWYDYLFATKDKAVCTFSNGGVDSQSDLYANLGSVRTIESFNAIQATVHWALFIAADTLVARNGTLGNGGNTTHSVGHPGASVSNRSNSSNSSAALAWMYLQQARHFERLRLNEQLERMEYEQQLLREKEAEEDPIKAAQLEANFLTEEMGEIDDIDSDTVGDTESTGGYYGYQPRLSAEERLDMRERRRSAAQAGHVVKFFEKGYWGEPEEVDYYKGFSATAGAAPTDGVKKGSDSSQRGSERAEAAGGSAEVSDHTDNGTLSRVPIFIVGFFRSGSTLLEDLLVKHAAIPGTVGAWKGEDSGTYTGYEATAEEVRQAAVAERLGFRRAAVWGMGEDSPFVFEMYAMQEETLAAYAVMEEQKKQLNPTTSAEVKNKKGKRSQQALQQREQELEKAFMHRYKEIVNHHAQTIVGKMHRRYREIHTNYTSPTTSDSTADKSHGSDANGEPPLPLHIVDKMLTNYINIGLIHMVFPRAIILHTVRDPLDTLFSCYANRFGDPSAAYTLHLSSLVQHYAHYLEVMQHFREVLPHYALPVWPTANSGAEGSSRDTSSTSHSGDGGGAKSKKRQTQALIDVRYEELVANPERVLRHLLQDVLGLEYVPSAAHTPTETVPESDGVPNAAHVGTAGQHGVDSDATGATAEVALSGESNANVPLPEGSRHNDHQSTVTNLVLPVDHAETVRVVRTASRLQIKAPVYWNSVGRWRQYATQLNATLIPALRQELPRLAALNALPYMDPTSELAKQTAKTKRKGGTKKSSKKQQKSSVPCRAAGDSAGGGAECAFANWDLRLDFAYDTVLSILRDL